MAFESVDVGSLQSALSACKDSINHSTTDNLIGKVSNSSIWECDARSSLKDGLSRLVGIRYAELQSKIDNGFAVCSLISEYKQLEEENERLVKEYNELNKKLWVEKTWYDDLGVMHSCTVKDGKVAEQMRENKQQRNNNFIKMQKLEQQVAGMV